MKLETDIFKSIFTEELKQLDDIFKKHNFEIRIAGGAVRYKKAFHKQISVVIDKLVMMFLGIY